MRPRVLSEFHSFPTLLRERGVVVESALASMGVSAADLDDSELHIDQAAVERFLRVAVETSGQFAAGQALR